eukprot:g46929.t1
MANNHDMQNFFCAVKTTNRPNTQGHALLPVKNGMTLIKDKEASRQQQGKQFRDLLNQGSIIDPSILECISQHATQHKLRNTRALHEVNKAIHQLTNNKTAGADGIPTETLKHGGKDFLLQLHALGCVIAPTVFLICHAAMLHLTANKLPVGMELIYRTSGKLFNLCPLQAKIKFNLISDIKLQYVNDAYVCINSEDKLQTIVSPFTEAYESMGLNLNTRKTKILCQPGLALWNKPEIIK